MAECFPDRLGCRRWELPGVHGQGWNIHCFERSWNLDTVLWTLCLELNSQISMCKELLGVL